MLFSGKSQHTGKSLCLNIRNVDYKNVFNCTTVVTFCSYHIPIYKYINVFIYNMYYITLRPLGQNNINAIKICT